MSDYKNWLPGIRTAQLTMSRDWISVLGAGGKAAVWNVPTATLTELGTVWSAAQAAKRLRLLAGSLAA